MLKRKDTPVMEDNPIELETEGTFKDALTDVARNEARQLLTDAVEAEVIRGVKFFDEIRGERIAT